MIDPHVDIADMYALMGWEDKDFFDSDSKAWVTLPKLEKAGIGVVGATLYFDESLVKTSFYNGVKSFMDFYQRLFQDQDKFKQIISYKDLELKGADQIGYFWSVEGMECLRTDKDFDELYDLGVRVWGFTWAGENLYASGRHSKRDEGLSREGLKVLERMKARKQVIIDIAHLGEQGVKDVGDDFEGMIVTTHGNARSVWHSQHNLTDQEIELIVDRGGVITLFPLTEDTGPNNSFEDLYRHVDYIAGKWGLDYVGLCSDIYPLPEYPFLEGYEDILIMRAIKEYLLTRMSEAEVEKIMHGNWQRVLESSL